MEKIKKFFLSIWKAIKIIANKIWIFCLSLVVFAKKIRDGEALELHPLVSVWTIRLFKAIFVVSVLFFAFCAAVAISIYGYRSNDPVTRAFAKFVPYPAVIIQGRIVTMDNYYRNYQYITKFYSSTQQTNVDYNEVKAQIITQLIDNEIMKSQAKKYGVKVLASDVTNAYSDVVTQNGGEEEVKKVLNDLYGLSVGDFKQLIRDQLLEQKLQETVPTQVSANHILIRINDINSEKDVADSKTKIDKIYADLKAGADFAEQAKQYSEDTGSATTGGELGFFSRGEMDTDFENTAFATPVSQISEPFKTQFGWHIIKVVEKKGQVDMSFSDWLASLEKQSLIIQFLKI